MRELAKPGSREKFALAQSHSSGTIRDTHNVHKLLLMVH